MYDRYDNKLSITSGAARDQYQQAMDCWLAAQPGAIGHYEAAIAHEPQFALAHAGMARALFIRSRVSEAKNAAEQAVDLAQNTKVTDREVAHVHIVHLLINGESAKAFSAIHDHASVYPRDALAIQPCSGVFGLIGFSGRPGREAENLAFLSRLASHYSGDWWFDSQHAFALCEVGQLAAAEKLNTHAVAANPANANAIHHQAHLHYEQGEAAAGIAALQAWRRGYSANAVLYGHLAWHQALWALAQGNLTQVSQILNNDLVPAANAAPPLNIMTDIVSLLLRIELQGADLLSAQKEDLWEMASAYASAHFAAPGLSFADAHSAIAHAITGNRDLVVFLNGSELAGVAGDLVQRVARAFRHFVQSEWQAMLAELAPVMAQHERLGGSRAQRDLLEHSYAYALIQTGQRRSAERWYQGRRPLLSPVGLGH